MKLLFDALKGGWTPITGQIPDEIKIPFAQFSTQTPILHIQNVADYFWEQGGAQAEHFSMKAFPNLAPPFPAFWMEFRVQELSEEDEKIMVDDDGKRIPDMYRTTHEGALIKAERVEGEENVKWRLFVSLFASAGSLNPKRVVWWGTFSFLVDQDGTPIPNPNAEDMMIENIWLAPPLRQLMETDGMERIASVMSDGALYPSLLALSFLHCKNVELVENDFGQRSPHSNLKKRTRNPKTKYYTLHIEAMKKVLRTEGDSERAGLSNALHICRGHFKDYSRGGGLFGKYQGLYWWESHVRGSETAGKIEKTYTVHPPKQENDDE